MDNNVMAKANKVAEVIKARGINAEVMTKNNNGTEQVGITVGDGTVRPTVYPNFDTNDLDKIADKVLEVYEENKDKEDFSDIIDHFTEFDFVKNDIIPVLVRKVADGVVTRDYLDLKVMYRYMIPNKPASIVVKNEHLKAWDITEDDLFELAKNNVRDRYTDRDMSEVIPIPADGMMRVVTLGTETESYGGSALLFPELFAKYDGMPILPSSIHELLVITENNTQTMGLADMIKSVNATELAPQDILSDHPYMYENGAIKEVA